MKKFWAFVIKADKLKIVLLAFLCLGLLNILVLRVGKYSFDLTQGKFYSLSSSTKEILNELDDVVSVDLYISKDLPSQMKTTADAVEDMFSEYQKLSGGKVRVKRYDPGGDPDLLAKAQRLGVSKVQFSSIESGKLEVSDGFLGVTIMFEDRHETLPFIKDVSGLEYEITSAILRVARQNKPKLGIFRPGGGADFETTEVRQLLSKDFDVDSVTIASDSASFNSQFDALLVVVGQKMADKELFALDQYIMKGGAALILSDPVNVSPSLVAREVDLGLDGFFTKNGLKQKKTLVMSQSAELANFSAGYTRFFTAYPFWVKIVGQGFNKDNPAVARLNEASFVWASPFEILEDGKEKWKPLITTVDMSWEMAGPSYNLSPTQKIDVKDEDFSARLLAVFAIGGLDSAFAKADSGWLPAGSEQIEHVDTARVVVIGDADFIRDDFLKANRANSVLLLNLLDYLGADERLLLVRSKTIKQRPIRNIDPSSQNAIRFANTFGLPMVVGVVGAWHLYKRQKRARK